jgi:hypothetical protein
VGEGKVLHFLDKEHLATSRMAKQSAAVTTTGLCIKGSGRLMAVTSGAIGKIVYSE